MRLTVPLQAVVQGRGGLILGSLIPCSLLYLLQFYLKRHRLKSPPPEPSPELLRSSSRPLLSNSASLDSARISQRSGAIAKPNDSPYYIGLDKALENPYDASDNPDGIIQLGLSENRLSLDLIEKWIEENMDKLKFEEDVCLSNDSMDGSIELKVAVAGFMSQVMGGDTSFDPSKLIITAGGTPAIEMLSFCLADQGNAFLVPTPYYPGFDRDVKWRTGVELIPVHCRSADNFSVTIPTVQQAYNQARKRGTKVTGILISNPSNPLGTILPAETLHDLLDFAMEKNIHVISDEIFAGSTFTGKKFTSMAELIEKEEIHRNRVHIIYGLSKDLSLPGFRVGVIYSHNNNVLAACKRLAQFCPVSTPTQRLLTSMLSDSRFICGFIAANKVRIEKMYTWFVEGLRELGIECSTSEGSLYCWANMGGLTRSYSEKGELDLWDELLEVGKVNATPGSSCHCIEPGWFRCCFASLSKEDVPVVLRRFSEFSRACRA